MENILTESNQARIQSLAEQISLNHVIPYIGAGMSMPPFCGWGEYLKRIDLPAVLKGESETGSRDQNGSDFEEWAQSLDNRYPIRFVEETQKAFATERIHFENLNDSVKLLPKLFRCPIFTTNLDQVLETVYEEAGIRLKTALAGETGYVQKNVERHAPFLWKIHGDIEKNDEWVLTKDQYNYQYLDSDKKTHRKGVISFRELLSMYLQTNRLLFLGCSLKNDRIVDVMGELFQSNHSIRHYAILPLPPSENFAERDSMLENRGIQAIWYENRTNDHREVTQILQKVLVLVQNRYTDSFGMPARNEHSEAVSAKKKPAAR